MARPMRSHSCDDGKTVGRRRAVLRNGSMILVGMGTVRAALRNPVEKGVQIRRSASGLFDTSLFSGG